jgi:hypothetical protein
VNRDLFLLLHGLIPRGYSPHIYRTMPPRGSRPPVMDSQPPNTLAEAISSQIQTPNPYLPETQPAPPSTQIRLTINRPKSAPIPASTALTPSSGAIGSSTPPGESRNTKHWSNDHQEHNLTTLYLLIEWLGKNANWDKFKFGNQGRGAKDGSRKASKYLADHNPGSPRSWTACRKKVRFKGPLKSC